MTDQTENRKDLAQPESRFDIDHLRAVVHLWQLFYDQLTAVIVTLKEGLVETCERWISIDNDDKHPQDHSQTLAQEKYTQEETFEKFKKLLMDLNSLYESLKILSDQSIQLANSPRRVVSPKDDSMASTAKGTSQRTNEEDSDLSDREAALQKDTSIDNIPSDAVAAQEDGDSTDDTGSATRLAVIEQSNNEVTPSMGASATSQKDNLKNITPLDPKEDSQQSDGNSSSSNENMTPPQHTSAASEMEVTPNNLKSSVDQIVLDDDEFDLVSPEGMRRMFGTQSQESKIQFPPPSPPSNEIMTPPKDTETEANPGDPKYPADQVVLDDDEFDLVSPEGMRRMFGTQSQESKIQFLPPSPPSNEIMTPPKDTPAASETEASSEDPKYPADQVVLGDNIDLVSPEGMRRMLGILSQESKIQFLPPSSSSNENITPPKNTSAASETDVIPDNQKYSANQIVPDDDEFDLVSPEGMRRMFGSQSQESTIQFPPPSPSSNEDMTPPRDTSAASMEVTPDDQKYSADQTVLDDDEFDLVSPEGMKRMFGTQSQESKIQFPPPSPIYIREDSPTKMKINFEVDPVGGENES